MASQAPLSLQALEKLPHSERVSALVELGKRSLQDQQVKLFLNSLANDNGFFGKELALYACRGSLDTALPLNFLKSTSRAIRALSLSVLRDVASDEILVQVLQQGVARGELKAIVRNLKKQGNRQTAIDQIVDWAASKQDLSVLQALVCYASLEKVGLHWPSVEKVAQPLAWGLLANYHPRYAAGRVRGAAAAYARALEQLEPGQEETDSEVADLFKPLLKPYMLFNWAGPHLVQHLPPQEVWDLFMTLPREQRNKANPRPLLKKFAPKVLELLLKLTDSQQPSSLINLISKAEAKRAQRPAAAGGTAGTAAAAAGTELSAMEVDSATGGTGAMAGGADEDDVVSAARSFSLVSQPSGSSFVTVSNPGGARGAAPAVASASSFSEGGQDVGVVADVAAATPAVFKLMKRTAEVPDGEWFRTQALAKHRLLDQVKGISEELLLKACLDSVLAFDQVLYKLPVARRVKLYEVWKVWREEQLREFKALQAQVQDNSDLLWLVKDLGKQVQDRALKVLLSAQTTLKRLAPAQLADLADIIMSLLSSSDYSSASTHPVYTTYSAAIQQLLNSLQAADLAALMARYGYGVMQLGAWTDKILETLSAEQQVALYKVCKERALAGVQKDVEVSSLQPSLVMDKLLTSAGLPFSEDASATQTKELLAARQELLRRMLETLSARDRAALLVCTSPASWRGLVVGLAAWCPSPTGASQAQEEVLGVLSRTLKPAALTAIYNEWHVHWTAAVTGALPTAVAAIQAAKGACQQELEPLLKEYSSGTAGVPPGVPLTLDKIKLLKEAVQQAVPVQRALERGMAAAAYSAWTASSSCLLLVSSLEAALKLQLDAMQRALLEADVATAYKSGSADVAQEVLREGVLEAMQKLPDFRGIRDVEQDALARSALDKVDPAARAALACAITPPAVLLSCLQQGGMPLAKGLKQPLKNDVASAQVAVVKTMLAALDSDSVEEVYKGWKAKLTALQSGPLGSAAAVLEQAGGFYTHVAEALKSAVLHAYLKPWLALASAYPTDKKGLARRLPLAAAMQGEEPNKLLPAAWQLLGAASRLELLKLLHKEAPALLLSHVVARIVDLPAGHPGTLKQEEAAVLADLDPNIFIRRPRLLYLLPKPTMTALLDAWLQQRAALQERVAGLLSAAPGTSVPTMMSSTIQQLLGKQEPLVVKGLAELPAAAKVQLFESCRYVWLEDISTSKVSVLPEPYRAQVARALILKAQEQTADQRSLFTEISPLLEWLPWREVVDHPAVRDRLSGKTPADRQEGIRVLFELVSKQLRHLPRLLDYIHQRRREQDSMRQEMLQQLNTVLGEHRDHEKKEEEKREKKERRQAQSGQGASAQPADMDVDGEEAAAGAEAAAPSSGIPTQAALLPKIKVLVEDALSAKDLSSGTLCTIVNMLASNTLQKHLVWTCGVLGQCCAAYGPQGLPTSRITSYVEQTSSDIKKKWWAAKREAGTAPEPAAPTRGKAGKGGKISRKRRLEEVDEKLLIPELEQHLLLVADALQQLVLGLRNRQDCGHGIIHLLMMFNSWAVDAAEDLHIDLKAKVKPRLLQLVQLMVPVLASLPPLTGSSKTEWKHLAALGLLLVREMPGSFLQVRHHLLPPEAHDGRTFTPFLVNVLDNIPEGRLDLLMPFMTENKSMPVIAAKAIRIVDDRFKDHMGEVVAAVMSRDMSFAVLPQVLTFLACNRQDMLGTLLATPCIKEGLFRAGPPASAFPPCPTLYPKSPRKSKAYLAKLTKYKAKCGMAKRSRGSKEPRVRGQKKGPKAKAKTLKKMLSPKARYWSYRHASLSFWLAAPRQGGVQRCCTAAQQTTLASTLVSILQKNALSLGDARKLLNRVGCLPAVPPSVLLTLLEGSEGQEALPDAVRDAVLTALGRMDDSHQAWSALAESINATGSSSALSAAGTLLTRTATQSGLEEAMRLMRTLNWERPAVLREVVRVLGRLASSHPAAVDELVDIGNRPNLHRSVVQLLLQTLGAHMQSSKVQAFFTTCSSSRDVDVAKASAVVPPASALGLPGVPQFTVSLFESLLSHSDVRVRVDAMKSWAEAETPVSLEHGLPVVTRMLMVANATDRSKYETTSARTHAASWFNRITKQTAPGEGENASSLYESSSFNEDA